MKRLTALLCTALFAASVTLAAHQETFKGKAVSAGAAAVKITYVDAKTKKNVTRSFKVDAATKVLRGDTQVKFADAKVRADENIAVTVDHDKDEHLARVIRLDAAK